MDGNTYKLPENFEYLRRDSIMAAHGSRPHLHPLTSPSRSLLVTVAALILLSIGCGTVREHRATTQLLLSDAVDRSVANIDFTPLAHEKVYLDTRYVQIKSNSEVTTNYVISSLRQQAVVAGCLLQDRIEDADYVVEARVGTMGSDGYDINYGVPPSSSLATAANLVSSTQIPVLPEISLAKRTEDMAAVKIAVFAYSKDTKLPVWQSGTSIAKSEASGTWVLGAGPFKRGSIYDRTQFAGKDAFDFPAGKRALKFGEKLNLWPRDYTYRGHRIWDPEILKKIQEGGQLPTFQTPAFGVPVRLADLVSGKKGPDTIQESEPPADGNVEAEP